MPVPGSSVLRDLDRILERVRGELQTAQNDFAYVEERLAEFVTRRQEAIVALAEHFLPKLDDESVSNSFEGVRADLSAVLARKNQRDQRLRDDLQRQQSELNTLLAERNAIDAELAEIAAERTRLEGELAARLADDEDFQRATKLALQAEERLHRNEERFNEVREDAAKKLPQYDESRLFRYLYDRRFGRPEYAGTGFTKRMDRWVSKLIDYSALRHGYDFLQTTPAMMEAEIERRRGDFEELMATVERMEGEAERSSGLPELEPRVDELSRRRERLERDIASREKRVQQAEAAVEATDEEDDRFYREALDRLRRFLETVHTEALAEQAAGTPESRDDEIVADLSWLTTEIAALQPELEQRTAQRDEAKRRVKGLEFVTKRFRQSTLDSVKSIFPATFDVDSAVERFLVNAVDERTLWEQVRGEHDTEHTPLEELATEIGQSGSTGRVLWRAMTELSTAAAAQSIGRSVSRRSKT